MSGLSVLPTAENGETISLSIKGLRPKYKEYLTLKEIKDIDPEEVIKAAGAILKEDIKDWINFSASKNSSIDDIILRIIIGKIANFNYVCLNYIYINETITGEMLDDIVYVSSNFFSFDDWDDRHVNIVSKCAGVQIAINKDPDMIKLYSNTPKAYYLNKKPIPVRYSFKDCRAKFGSDYLKKYNGVILDDLSNAEYNRLKKNNINIPDIDLNILYLYTQGHYNIEEIKQITGESEDYISKVIEKEPAQQTIHLHQKPAEIKYFKLKMPKKVTWSEDTVDNEHMGKKKSNICCIYHKPKLSPDDSDTSSCDSCDEKGKNAYERPNHYDRKNKGKA